MRAPAAPVRVCCPGAAPARAVRSERPAVKGTLQPVAAHGALREIGPQVGTLRIDGVRVPTRIAIHGNPPATELGRTNLPPPDRTGISPPRTRLRHSSRARKEPCHETAGAGRTPASTTQSGTDTLLCDGVYTQCRSCAGRFIMNPNICRAAD